MSSALKPADHMQRLCRKCGFLNLSADGEEFDACPKCGAVYSKVEKALIKKIEEPGLPVTMQKIPLEIKLHPVMVVIIKALGIFVLWFIATVGISIILGVPGLILMMLGGMIALYILFRKKALDMQIICPNPHCGYRGPAQRRARGSLLVAIVLFMCFIIPGLLYLFLKSGYRYSCPQCNMQVSVDN